LRYFKIETIKEAIEHLQTIKPNWLLTSFVLASNDVGSTDLVDLAQGHGTDQFLNRYFSGSRLDIPPFPKTGNNLLRPRLKGMPDWVKGPFAGDYIIRQDTKLWATILSSRGYREMRLAGLLEGDKTLAKLTPAFQGRFEQEIPADFQFESFLVWLFAFEGFPDDVDSWDALYQRLLADHLHLTAFPPEYLGRFRLTQPPVAWPETTADRPDNVTYLHELAPKLEAFLQNADEPDEAPDDLPDLPQDDPYLNDVQSVVTAGLSYSILLAGPPGTGKTRYARQLAKALTDGDPSRVMFLQFHPALGYDDFVEGFRPTPSDDGKSIQYSLEPRLLMKFAETAQNDADKQHVLVIDELNRGDVARIFGEALTYLEADYRGKSFTLSFSGNLAHLPRKLLVIATANPFDRSVTDLDDALLRRFWVIEMLPDKALLEKHLKDAEVEQGVVNRTLRVFDIMNAELPSGFGHTSLLPVRSVEDLSAIWLGRLRLMLHRSLIADRPRFDAVSASIEALLSIEEAEGEVAADEAA
jgi:5-methylcytosine-specific restriction protein B